MSNGTGDPDGHGHPLRGNTSVPHRLEDRRYEVRDRHAHDDDAVGYKEEPRLSVEDHSLERLPGRQGLARSGDGQLAVEEDANVGQATLLRGQETGSSGVVGQEEVEREAAGNGDDSLHDEQPSPARNAAGAVETVDDGTGHDTTQSGGDRSRGVENAESFTLFRLVQVPYK